MKRRARVVPPNHRSLTGYVSCGKGASEPFESSLERDLLVLLDFDPTVLEITTQPVRIDYLDQQGCVRHYTPDVLVEFEAYDPIIYEVKYRQDLKDNWARYRPKFKAALKYCKQRRMRFQVLTEREIRGSAFLANAKFLRPYRDVPRDEGIEEHLIRTLAILGDTTPEAVLVAAYQTLEWRMRALASLWRMVALNRVHANLFYPLTMTTPIWVTIGEGFIWQSQPLSYQLHQVPSSK